MALKATIHKADLSISDMDRGYYANHSLTLAQHPSETIERLMLRLAVFVLHASERLAFTRDIAGDDEPALWQKNYSDEIELWIDLGEPDERRMRQACGRADQVWVYTYNGRAGNVWWKGIESKLGRLDNLNVIGIDADTLAKLAALNSRGMQLQATVQDGQLWLSNGTDTVLVEGEKLKVVGE
ncbi:YaeQ family protein [Chitinimonas arctica]|uniref:YaeQ family protein n=1 Tax=Chitinimonas arctica TaxID=2594795 RepID=A0A516SG64_9NEIS|nr:YaeQ family protein [Chitinimonas arctica]QDQ27156.1 YaeQ family protein [Chitinimonas arctica]